MECACLARAMESRVWLMAAVWLAVLSLSVSAMSVPQLKDNEIQDQQEVEDSRRATWLDTRDMEQDFKDLVFMTIVELENEGRISPGVIAAAPKTKRGRWQGFCFRKTRSGRFLPYICWKGSRK